MLIDTSCVGDMRDDAGVLVGRLRVCAFRGNVVDRLSVLALIANRHVHCLLDDVEVELLVRRRGGEVEIAVHKRLRASVEERVNIQYLLLL